MSIDAESADTDAGQATSSPTIATRWPELAVAALLAGIAALVITDSLRVGAGWADDGPRAGYFPFYIGLGLLGSSLWIAASQLRHWKAAKHFATRAEANRVLSVFWPMTLYVVLIKLLGIYIASALLIGWFMTRHGKHTLVMRVAVAVGTPLVFFVVFERWFKVPLPKGPLEALLGL